MKSILPFLLLSLSILPVWGQNYTVSGSVYDSDNESLEAATIYVQTVKDSTVIDYTITNREGKFSLKGRTNETDLDFYISFIGFETFHKRLSLKEEAHYDLGKIVLSESSNTLGEVMVQGTAAPISIKKDTLEFNASSFKTKEDATLEDLLKKLPGVTVDNDGEIQVNGKAVTQIKINGKDFFGSDPKIATKNLPKDLLEKVQVVDSKSKEDEFTRRESDSEDKTINIVIREENNRGLFSRLTAGAGVPHKYSLNGIGNYFKNDLRLSLLGSANNINSIGFSFDDVFDAMGRNAYSIMRLGSNSGITKSHSGGMNFVDSWNEKVDLTADYFYNRASTETDSKVQRENILPDRHYFTNSNSTSKSINNNHRGNVYFEYQIDTLTRISLRPNITANDGYSNSHSLSESSDVNGNKINNTVTEQNSKVNSVDFSNRLDIIRRYGRNGGYFKVGINNRNETQKNEHALYDSRDTYDDNGVLIENLVQDQRIEEDRKQNQYSLDGGIRIPLSTTWKLDLDYTFTDGKNDNKRLLYEPDANDNYVEMNEELSSSFRSQNLNHRPRAGLVFEGEKINAGISGGLESTQLKNKEEFKAISFDNTYNNLFARVYMRYRINQSKSLYFNYGNSHNVPSIRQLQPVANTTNSLNIITGNPNLKPSLNNRFNLSYNNYDFRTHQGLFLFVRGNYFTNQVVARSVTDENLVRHTTYSNVNGQYDFMMGGRMIKEYRLKSKNILKPQLGVNSTLRKDVGYSNDVKYHSNTISLRPNFSLEYDIPDILNAVPSYTVSYNNTDYSLGSRSRQEYIDHNLQLDLTTYWPEKIVFGSNITYSRLGEVAPGFDRDYILWNASLGYKLLGDEGVLKLTVYDLLNQNISTARRTGEDYIQDSQDLVLKRYFMFSFTYKINKFGGKKMQEQRRGGGGYRYGRG